MEERIDGIKLVEIGPDGSPRQDLGMLSQPAAAACRQTAAHYQRTGFSPPWISFLAQAEGAIVGVCAFTAAPNHGRVEIAYHTFPRFEGRGVANAMVRALIARAQRLDPKIELFAQTLAVENASNAVLRKSGFQFARTLAHPEEGQIWEWRRKPLTPQ